MFLNRHVLLISFIGLFLLLGCFVSLNFKNEKQMIVHHLPFRNDSTQTFNLLTNENKFKEYQRSDTFLESSSKLSSTKYTIVLPTYHRNHLLRKAVQHYSTFKLVSKIIVIWFNEDKLPTPKNFQSYLNPKSIVNLEFYWMPNFVRLRYFPYPTIDTEAVLNVDDDILIEEKSAQKAFEHWKNNKNLMYGFVARSHKEIGKKVYEYIMSDTIPYSFLLANNIFLHRRYYRIYQDYIVQWESAIDRWQACEDIAMSFMLADLNKKENSAMKVQGKYKDIRDSEKYKGLSKRTGHHFQRSYCLNRFAERYKAFPLKKHSKILK